MGTMSTLSGLFTKIEQAVLEYYSKAGVDVHMVPGSNLSTWQGKPGR